MYHDKPDVTEQQAAENLLKEKLKNLKKLWHKATQFRPGLRREAGDLVSSLKKVDLQELLDVILSSIEVVKHADCFYGTESSSGLLRFFVCEEVRLVYKKDGCYYPSPLFAKAGIMPSENGYRPAP